MHKSIYENKRLRLGAGIITAAMVSLALSAGLPVAKSRAAVVGYEKKMETDAEGFKISEGFQLVEDDKASKNWRTAPMRRAKAFPTVSSVRRRRLRLFRRRGRRFPNFARR